MCVCVCLSCGGDGTSEVFYMQKPKLLSTNTWRLQRRHPWAMLGSGSATTPWWPCVYIHPHRSCRQSVEVQPESCLMLCDPPGTEDNVRRPCKELLWVHLPVIYLPPHPPPPPALEVLMRQFLLASRVLMRYAVFCLVFSEYLTALIYKHKFIKYKCYKNIKYNF